MTQESIEASSSTAASAGGRSVQWPVALSLLALGLGLLVEILFYGHRPGISFFLWAAACVLAVATAGGLEKVRVSTSAWLAMAGGLVFAGATFLRQEPFTVFLCRLLLMSFLAGAAWG